MGGAAKAVTNAVTDTVKAAGDVLQGGVNAVKDVGGGAVDTVKDAAKGINWSEIRDTGEAAAVVAGNYFLPGSSLVTSRLVSDGAQEKLNSDLGKVATVASGVSGGVNGNMSNWTGGSGGGASGADTLGGGGSATGVTSSPVTTGSAQGTDLGLQSGASTSAVSSGSVQATPITTAATASSGPPVVDLSFSPVTPQTMSVADVGSGGISATELAGYGAGSYAAGKYLDKKMNPDDGSGDTPASTTTPLVDTTAGETRATASDIANVLNFQDQASTRRRMGGAAMLAPTSTGSSNVGSKALLGA